MKCRCLLKLMVGIKYAILLRNDVYLYRTGTFKSNRVGGTFHYIIPHSDIKNINTYNTRRNIQDMNKTISFYAFVPKKEKIQQAMEQRALDKILKRLYLVKLICFYMIDHKMFFEVDKKNLVLGKEYTIVSSYDKGIYITATLIRNIAGYGQKFENPVEHSGDTYNTLLRIRNKKNNPNYFDFVTLSEVRTTPRYCLDCHSKLPFPSNNHIAKMDPSSPKFANWSPQLRCTPCARVRRPQPIADSVPQKE